MPVSVCESAHVYLVRNIFPHTLLSSHSTHTHIGAHMHANSCPRMRPCQLSAPTPFSLIARRLCTCHRGWVSLWPGRIELPMVRQGVVLAQYIELRCACSRVRLRSKHERARSQNQVGRFRRAANLDRRIPTSVKLLSVTCLWL